MKVFVVQFIEAGRPVEPSVFSSAQDAAVAWDRLIVALSPLIDPSAAPFDGTRPIEAHAKNDAASAFAWAVDLDEA